jgi:Tfp pilus assembly protein PilV
MATRRRPAQRGAGLIEAMVAMAVTSVVVLALAALVLYGVRLQQLARNTTAATAAAIAEIERLRVLPPGAAERQVGGSLVADVAGHFRTSQAGLVARWVVAPGPAGTDDITVRVVFPVTNVRAPDVRVLLFP